ncbi:MAG: UTP--glucose-1-phosphate uridylyltransferase GalU [Gammaproteobacteria bacterium]|jgi:UTP--glucose-1-phosphate uridylyltransferase
MSVLIRKAVFPVAGLGTRFLPATKANPKEMLPIVDKPLIQYAAEEAVAAGITELIFITGQAKRAIEDHFDKARELEAELETRGKYKLLAQVRDILPPQVTCVYIRQPEPLGLGHAVLCARSVIGNEPFAVLLADDLIDGEGSGCTAQMVETYDRHHCSVLAVQPVAPMETDQYGVVSVKPLADRLSQVEEIVEKPAPSIAPSNLGVVGRYILTPTVFELLERTRRGAGGEIQLTDAIAKLLTEEQVLALQFAGKRYDCGSKLGYLKAMVAYAVKHRELQDDFCAYLHEITSRDRETLRSDY